MAKGPLQGAIIKLRRRAELPVEILRGARAPAPLSLDLVEHPVDKIALNTALAKTMGNLRGPPPLSRQHVALGVGKTRIIEVAPLHKLREHILDKLGLKVIATQLLTQLFAGVISARQKAVGRRLDILAGVLFRF